MVRWVAESQRPFTITEDRGFRRLMKEGRPSQYIPSARTVGRDVRAVFKKSRERIGELLRVSASVWSI